MSQDLAEQFPTQLLVPGRGLEPASAEQPGTVQFNSLASGDSYDRAVCAADYVNMHPEVETILFSGDCTFVLPEHEIPQYGAEGSAMQDVAYQRSMRTVRSKALLGARSTYGNYTEAAPDLDLNKPCGIVAQADHMPRALRIGHFVLPTATLIPIVATNPDRTEHNMALSNRDRMAALVYGIGMMGVRAGDIPAISRRDLQIQRAVLRLLAARNLFGRVIKPHRAII